MFPNLIRELKWWWYGRKSPTIAASRSKECRKLRECMKKTANPIPPDVWNEMPVMLKAIILSAQKDGAVVNYNPSEGKTGFAAMFGDTVTVFYGPLMSRVYNAKTGVCVVMS
jgi:hypothetical protein